MPYEFFVRDGFVELRLFGVLGPAPEPLTVEERDQIRSAGSVLYNYNEVVAIRFDAFAIAENLKRNLDRGMRVAAVSSVPSWFGVNRQLEQLSDAHPDQARLFRDRDEAIRWLQSFPPTQRYS